MAMARYRTMMKFLISVGILFQGCDSDVKCRDDKGKEVDWYILYKLPRVKDDGLSYLYMDESTNGWKASKETINSKSSTLANTLNPLLDFYDRKIEGFGYMLYNDQPPEPYAAPASFGHSKGLQLKYIHAYSYDSDIPTTFHKELQCVAQRSCYPKKEPWFRVKMLTSMTGHNFSSFAKYTRFWDDLYSGLIVNHLKQDLYIKSWGKMRKPLPSNCSTDIPHHVYNVKEVKLLKGKPFGDTVDHSKWCVTSGGGWTCIADMNREESQMKRAGGAICTDNVAVGKAFHALITQYEPCKHDLPHSEAQHREL
ncbi:deoxyribonuclease-2-beta-like isoform X3 [Perca fluviatilis]|uniref:deoxyribonuclease-2-beta-like isoform X3 n=1 Tax=Perca fluviatilis TaxID=8168 RepID=UPI001964C952|nr:deoxyribonuclease-2-beta-like isoform X3 [Perca fluviatilis]